MADILRYLSETPIPTILVIGGLFFLSLPFVRRVSGSIEPEQGSKKWAVIIGILLIFIGIGLYIVPQMNQKQALTSSIPTSVPTILSDVSTTKQSSEGTKPTNTDQMLTFTVSAKGDWQNTGVYIHSGETVEINYESGTWSYNGEEFSGPEGPQSQYICSTYMDPKECVEKMPSAVQGSLVGKINNDIFYVGKSKTFISSETGPLELAMNEGNGVSLVDNKGELKIIIQVKP